ncbi:ATP-binding protein [Porphyrobacter sp. ULC335]|uniref:ATP-binding protein n=1 Tax=Porphyrobacter sp. ULC335 TaxID=2854260 RepID=UPI00221F2E9B|nr:ATP-binding protein [Porphyrobacter sp. ULC335]UYV16011.1 ATP-binding protein [Porphyrobacter sp. ULC335]
MSNPTLDFDHNIIEHLGIKLYQNRPVNVLAELVSNSWDAGALNTWIDVSSDQNLICVSDDGSGMSLNDIASRYLIIGLQKREEPTDLAGRERKPMGRKGIGKLAPFGIARTVEVVSLKDGLANWFTLDLDEIIEAQPQKRYEPKFRCKNDAISEIDLGDFEYADSVTKFLHRVKDRGTGTLIILSRLTSNRVPTPEYVLERMAARFTTILARDDFTVWVNEDEIEYETAMPEFELRIPSDGFEEVEIGGRKVKAWAGFFKKAETATDEAGVGVYAHGKIAQDRPFFFYSKGKEVFQRYLYAVVEADWIDELEDDVISTDRTSVNWEHDQLEEMAEWGRKKVNSWLSQYDAFRKSLHKSETSKAARALREERKIYNFSQTENEEIDTLVAKATAELPKSQIEASREGLLEAVTKAWANEPTRILVKQLWDTLSEGGNPSKTFEAILTGLHKNSVPESMGLAITFAQRAYAVTVLAKLVNERSEQNLQDLIEEFPWIIDPSGALVTADRHLKTTINNLADKFDGDRYEPLAMIKEIPESSRADFVFLSDAGDKNIKVIELKAPGGDTLQKRNERQLVAYLDHISQHYPSAQISGVLVGNVGPSPGYRADDQRVTVQGWDSVLTECRVVYVELLASMLIRSDVTPSDDRFALIQKFAGDDVWELLHRIAEKDPALREVMKKFEYLTST